MQWYSVLHSSGMVCVLKFDDSQLLRGTLEGCILKIISRETTYGYEIQKSLKMYGFEDVAEGTIYPLLLRLEKQGHISSQFLSSPLGPKRKYYSITSFGIDYLQSFEKSWGNISRTVKKVFGEKGEEE